MEISFKKISGYRHIYGLNNFNENIDIVYKYSPLKRFIQELRDKQLVFVSPVKWINPCERIYYNFDYSDLNYLPEEIFCMCFTSDASINECLSWNLYIDENRQSVCSGIKISKIFEILEMYSNYHNCSIYIGNVNYTYNTNELYQKSEILNQWDNKNMETKDYISLMLLKEKSLSFQNEIRIFIVNHDLGTSYNSELLKIHCNYKELEMFESVILSPYIKESECTEIAKIQNKMYELKNNEIIRQIGTLINAKDIVRQSFFYDAI